MKTYSEKEVQDLIGRSVLAGEADMQEDNQGQLIIYTGIYRWADGTLHDYADPNYEDDEDDQLDL